MLNIDHVTITKWAEHWKGRQTTEQTIANYEALKTTMTNDEKVEVEQSIAETLLEVEEYSEHGRNHIIATNLIRKGFHPAFQHDGVVNGLEALETLKAAIAGRSGP